MQTLNPNRRKLLPRRKKIYPKVDDLFGPEILRTQEEDTLDMALAFIPVVIELVRLWTDLVRNEFNKKEVKAAVLILSYQVQSLRDQGIRNRHGHPNPTKNIHPEHELPSPDLAVLTMIGWFLSRHGP